MKKLFLCIYVTIVMVLNSSKHVLCASTTTATNTHTIRYPEVHNRNWTRSEKLDPNGILNLQWSVRNNEIIFEVILNSRGFVAIGFPYANAQIKGFDVVLAWVNDKTGKANILVNFIYFYCLFIKWLRCKMRHHRA